MSVTISSLNSEMMVSFLMKTRLTISRWKSFLSRQRVRIRTMPTFLIFFSTVGFSLMLSRISRHTKNSLSCFQIRMLSFLSWALALILSLSSFLRHSSMYSEYSKSNLWI